MLDVAQISAPAGRLTRKLAVYPTIFTNAAGEQNTVYDFWRAYCARVAEVEAAHQAALAGLAARADQRHAWVMAGDPRGTYGEP